MNLLAYYKNFLIIFIICNCDNILRAHILGYHLNCLTVSFRRCPIIYLLNIKKWHRLIGKANSLLGKRIQQ